MQRYNKYIGGVTIPSFDVVCVRVVDLNRSVGTLRASVDLAICVTGGSWLILRNFQLHERDGKRWVQGPVQRKGATYAQLVSWKDDREREAFRRAALRAIDGSLELRNGEELK